ncbi:T9SS type A sorting domain-containing protein [Fulvivirga ulvae]|uniref:T9SS type A sorting domain-containing protein n=1 Tax=Fulvivirga ulvae TaxID=2904245 RepID=UPI001F3BB373|nr:T9SS type A sorting domain-containing protein [Fulvivirga ulvae]UII29564.1 T9SS type A sorting domain-containing protein [Fulvivirga ulvae]
MKTHILKIQVSIFAIFIITSSAFAQITYTSNDNQLNNWDDISNWSSADAWSTAPKSPGNPTNSNCARINVYGFTRIYSSLSVNNANPAIHIYDTLFVDGNVTLGSGASMEVHANGLLIVTGNYTSSGSFKTTNSGRVIVVGDLNITEGTTLHTNNQTYIFGDLNNTNGYVGTGPSDQCYTWGSCDPTTYTSTENDLYNNDKLTYDFVTSGGVLPVEIADFKAVENKGKALLSWSTLSEVNFDYFTIEKSTDGVRFNEVARIKGAGNSNEKIDYSWIGIASETAYYRIKATDFDGYTEYHGTVYMAMEETAFDYKVYPNPVTGRIINIKSGSRLYTATLAGMNGQNIALKINGMDYQTQLELPDSVKEGYYILTLVFETETATQKILIR